jgi:hypothetical protein
MPPILIAHKGPPCDPPIADGITFAPTEADPNLYLGEAPNEEVAASITRCPAFTRFGGAPLKPRLSSSEEEGGTYDLAKPVAQWTAKALVAFAAANGVPVADMDRVTMIAALAPLVKAAKAAAPPAE